MGCFSVLVAGAVLVAVSWRRISSVARDVVALFDGVEVAALQSVDALVDFIEADRSRVSLVAYRLDDPESAIRMNPDVRRPVASTIKILVLAGYAEAVDEGWWSPLERVPLAAVETFFLPGTDGGAHDRAVEVYRERGWLDGSDSVSLRDVWFTLAKGRVRRDRVGREGGEVHVTAEVDVREPNRLNRDLLRRLLSDPEFFERVRRRLDARPAARGGAVVQELDGRSSRRRLLCPIRAAGRIVDVARGEVGRK